jgi:hypothetical protein
MQRTGNPEGEVSLPYFVYRVFAFPVRRLEQVATLDAFREASARAKALRADPGLPSGCAVRMIFAANELEAEDLLSQLREAPPGVVGDE